MDRLSWPKTRLLARVRLWERMRRWALGRLRSRVGLPAGEEAARTSLASPEVSRVQPWRLAERQLPWAVEASPRVARRWGWAARAWPLAPGPTSARRRS